ncbi:MAG: AAA family ATPase [Prevotella sp.]|jgi:excinuclease ATPase subunit|uniref:AAA family ATPase n=1 Tax=Prevotella melaninogenica TaxID=28132 RepID=UPI001C5F5B97|nr:MULTISPECIES: AAA family ATPase [Prevotella]MBF1583744.1 AAA family ATPase [Prevotella sp.]MBF1600174.1 AAA family ATPase [Prevotella sp.]MBW4723337.1 AAA family ATPase [Prevotella melaninogenica]
MQISRLQIKNLYDQYNYDIDFNSEEKEQITILTGPNGYGKTTILRILKSLNPKSLYYFYVIKFSEIIISFDNNTVLNITQNYKTEVESIFAIDYKDELEKEVRFIWNKATGEPLTHFVYNRTNIEKARRTYKFLRETYSRRWKFDDLTNREKEEILLDNEEFNEYIAKANRQKQFLMQLKTLRSYYIPANRIYNEAHEENDELPIEKVREALMAELEIAQQDYLRYSQEVDSKFIKKVLYPDYEDCPQASYNKLKDEVESLMKTIVKYKLALKVEIPEYNEKNRAVLFAYLKGLEEKFSKISTISKKTELFQEMLSSKGFANKSVEIAPQHGFMFKSDKGDILKAHQLSSGEQNEIVMLYRLVYEVPDQGILLIDEPENSLHVAWQKTVVDDMKKIADIKRLQIIIATHSPSIVSKGFSMTQDLYYLTNK